MTIDLKWERRVKALGLPYMRVQRGWTGSARYGWKPREVLEMSAENKAVLDASIAGDSAKRAAQRAKRQRQIEDAAYALGILPDSRAFAAYRRGEIDADEARRIGEYTRRRHEDTSYESLLARGVDRETAREIAAQELRRT